MKWSDMAETIINNIGRARIILFIRRVRAVYKENRESRVNRRLSSSFANEFACKNFIPISAYLILRNTSYVLLNPFASRPAVVTTKTRVNVNFFIFFAYDSSRAEIVIVTVLGVFFYAKHPAHTKCFDNESFI